MGTKPFNVLDGGECAPEVMGGYRSRIGIYRKCDVTAVPRRDAMMMGEPSPATRCKVTGSFTLKTGGKLMVVDCVPGSVGYKGEPQGEVGSSSFKPSGQFRVGDKDTADALAAELVNGTCYLLIDEHDGRQLMVGNESYPAVVKPAFDGGQKAADARGYTFTYEVEGQHIPKQYMGMPIDLNAAAVEEEVEPGA